MARATLGMDASYNSNSLLQKTAVQLSTEFIKEAIDALDVTSVDIIADFGSSHGVNSIDAMKTIIDYLRKTKNIVKDPLVIHNDLPTNDWTLLFQLLIKDNSYNGVASGRSFYEQCLPNNSLSIGYSSTSIQWLSKKPCNVPNQCRVDPVESPKECQAFRHQAYLDYSQFLQHRSCELIPGGVLILTIPSTNNQGKMGLENVVDTFYKCAQLVPLTSQELLDYTIPCYLRYYNECVDENLFTQHSFQLLRSEFISIGSPLFKQWKEEQITLDDFVCLTTSFVRSFSESILQQTLMDNGRTQEDITIILNQFWTLFKDKIREQPEIGNCSLEYVYIILKKT